MYQILQHFTHINCLALLTILGGKCYQYSHMRKLRFGDLAKGPEFSNYGTEIGSRVPVPEPVLLTSTVSALSQNCILLKFPEDIF